MASSAEFQALVTTYLNRRIDVEVPVTKLFLSHLIQEKIDDTVDNREFVVLALEILLFLRHHQPAPMRWWTEVAEVLLLSKLTQFGQPLGDLLNSEVEMVVHEVAELMYHNPVNQAVFSLGPFKFRKLLKNNLKQYLRWLVTMHTIEDERLIKKELLLWIAQGELWRQFAKLHEADRPKVQASISKLKS